MSRTASSPSIVVARSPSTRLADARRAAQIALVWGVASLFTNWLAFLPSVVGAWHAIAAIDTLEGMDGRARRGTHAHEAQRVERVATTALSVSMFALLLWMLGALAMQG